MQFTYMQFNALFMLVWYEIAKQCIILRLQLIYFTFSPCLVSVYVILYKVSVYFVCIHQIIDVKVTLATQNYYFFYFRDPLFCIIAHREKNICITQNKYFLSWATFNFHTKNSIVFCPFFWVSLDFQGIVKRILKFSDLYIVASGSKCQNLLFKFYFRHVLNICFL